MGGDGHTECLLETDGYPVKDTNAKVSRGVSGLAERQSLESPAKEGNVKQKQWFLVPRRENQKSPRVMQLTQPVSERLRQARVEAKGTARSAGTKKWFEHPRRTS